MPSAVTIQTELPFVPLTPMSPTPLGAPEADSRGTRICAAVRVYASGFVATSRVVILSLPFVLPFVADVSGHVDSFRNSHADSGGKCTVESLLSSAVVTRAV